MLSTLTFSYMILRIFNILPLIVTVLKKYFLQHSLLSQAVYVNILHLPLIILIIYN